MVHLIWTPIPSSLTLPPEQSQERWCFIVVVADSLSIAETSFDEGLELMATGGLRRTHEAAWKELWLKSKVEVVGSERLLKAVIGCMFYVLSAFPSIHDPTDFFGGVSPGGLSNGSDTQDYWGHVFWDQVGIIPPMSAVAVSLVCHLTAISNPTGDLDTSHSGFILPQAGPCSTGVQGADYRWSKIQCSKAGTQGMSVTSYWTNNINPITNGTSCSAGKWCIAVEYTVLIRAVMNGSQLARH